MTKDEAMQQALVALGEFGYHGSSPRWERAVNDLRTALEQPPLPVQEPTQWRDMVVVSLVREGINKHKARELADHFAAQPVQEPVGEVTEVSDNGFKCEFNQRLAVGTKLYIAPPLPVQEPWGACVSGRVFVGRLPEHARKISEDEGAPIQWLYTTPPAPQRPWQGMTEQDMPSGEDPMFDHKYFIAGMVYAAKVLQEKNNAAPAAQPEQQAEPVACRFCHSKKGCWTWQCYKCGEIDDVQQPAPPPVQESVSMRMPKVGDKVICLEDESLGEVVSLTAGGSPDILFADGSHGTYLLREFAELFGYAEQRQQQAEPPPEWPLIKNILAVFGLDAIAFVAAWKAAQQQAEPVTWDKPSDNFNDWWDGDRRRDNANPFTTDSFAYWAFEGWQAALAQRPWVKLTDEEIMEMMGYDKQYGYIPQYSRNFVEAITAKLMEKNA